MTGFQRIDGCGPQRYNAYPGTMKVEVDTTCEQDCEFTELEATAVDLAGAPISATRSVGSKRFPRNRDVLVHRARGLALPVRQYEATPCGAESRNNFRKEIRDNQS